MRRSPHWLRRLASKDRRASIREGAEWDYGAIRPRVDKRAQLGPTVSGQLDVADRDRWVVRRVIGMVRHLFASTLPPIQRRSRRGSLVTGAMSTASCPNCSRTLLASCEASSS